MLSVIVFLSVMSAWYDDTPEGPPPPLAPQMMDLQCDYGVLNHAMPMPSWPDGKQELVDAFTCQVGKDAACLCHLSTRSERRLQPDGVCRGGYRRSRGVLESLP